MRDGEVFVVFFYHKTRTPIMAAQRARVPLNAIGIYWSIGTFVHSSLWWNPACASNNSKQLRQLQLKWLPQMHAVTCRFGTVWWMSGLSLQPQIVIHLRGNLLQHKRPRFQCLLKLEILHRWFPQNAMPFSWLLSCVFGHAPHFALLTSWLGQQRGWNQRGWTWFQENDNRQREKKLGTRNGNWSGSWWTSLRIFLETSLERLWLHYIVTQMTLVLKGWRPKMIDRFQVYHVIYDDLWRTT